MRVVVVVAVILALGLPAIAAAQSGRASRGRASTSLPPLAPIGLPLPQISAPLAPIGLPLGNDHSRFMRSLEPPRTTNRFPRFDQPLFPPGHGLHDRIHEQPIFDRHRGFRNQPTVVYFFPAYPIYWEYPIVQAPVVSPPYPYDTPALPPPPLPPPPVTRVESPTGILRLQLEFARSASQVYVDGYFVGTLGDLNGEVVLEPGPHKIEVRADGFEPLAFDVKIVVDRAITYRHTMQRLADAVPAAASAAPATLYYIPGCYLGNVAPDQVALPPNCDLSRMITRTP